MRPVDFQFIFDPLCAWSYASTESVLRLAEEYPVSLTLMPIGLFAFGGAREINRSWARYAWSLDQQVAEQTGLAFSETYRTKVLGRTALRFDSEPMIRAMTFLGEMADAYEIALVQALQTARYAHGLDTSKVNVVVDITAAVLAKAGHSIDRKTLMRMIVDTPGIADASHARVSAANAMIKNCWVKGTPSLLIWVGDELYQLSGRELYGEYETLTDKVRQLTQ
jgi:putative protein-disulfide isomerase